MNHLFKAFMAFVASTFLVLTTSLPSKDVVNYIDNSDAAMVSEVSEEFYSGTSMSRKYVNPVVKLNLEMSSPFGTDTVSSATGVVVKYDKKLKRSYIITNNHFCEDINRTPFPSRIFYEDSKTAMSLSGETNPNSLEVMDMDPSKDLCLLGSNDKLSPAKVAPEDYKLRQMEPVIIVGGPKGIFPVMLNTYVSNLIERDFLPPHMIPGEPLLLISEIIYSGHSGSPVYNKKGEVVGLVFMNLSDEKGPIYGSFAIPLKEIRDFIERNDIKI